MAGQLNYNNQPLWSPSIGDLPSFTQMLAQSDLSLSEAIVPAAITTVGNGTITATALNAGAVVRSGPTAAYTDTFDTIANIIASQSGGWVSGGGFQCILKNLTAFPQTLSAGATGIVLPTTIIVGPWQEAIYSFVFGGTANAPTITVYHLSTGSVADAAGVTSPQITSVTTVGAATLAAAAIAQGIISRGGAQSNAAFVDTTDTATNIIAANPGLIGKIGSSCLFYYQNGTNATVTFTGGTGVNSAGTIDTIEGNCAALYQINYTAAATLVFTLIAKWNVPTAPNGTFVANGVTPVTVADSRLTANSVIIVTLKTVGGTVGAIPAPKTVTPGTGFTIAGTVSDSSTYNYFIVN
jgi:hypothetical protein